MKAAQILEKMIAFSGGNIHDIDHLIRVWTYAKLIGEGEGLDAETQLILEAAAITHDIACPLCREKYGSTEARHQEREGEIMARAFLADCGMTQRQLDRIAFLVGRHHTLNGVDGPDWQILLEADYIANASENAYSREKIDAFLERHVKTASGRRMFAAVFPEC